MEISYKLSFAVPKIDSLSSLPEDYPVLILPSDSTKFNKTRKANQERLQNSYGKKKFEFTRMDISNSGFQIYLIDKEDPHYASVWLKGSTSVFTVGLRHPELEKLGHPIVTYIYPFDLLEMITSSGYISDGLIHGTFCCEEVPGLSGNCSTKFVIENPDSKELKEAKRMGKTIGTSSKTTKWIPGHIYLFSNKARVLYLGETEDLFSTEKNRFGGDTYSFPLMFNPYNYHRILKSYGKGHLILYLDRIDDTLRAILEHSIGSNISAVSGKIIEYCLGNKYHDLLRYYVGKPKPAVDCEEAYKNDTTGFINISGIISSKFKIGTNEELLSVVNPTVLSDEDQELWKDIIVTKLKEWIKYNTSSRYSYSSSKPVIKRGMSVKDFITFSESTSSYDYYRHLYASSKRLLDRYYPMETESVIQKALNEYFH